MSVADARYRRTGPWAPRSARASRRRRIDDRIELLRGDDPSTTARTIGNAWSCTDVIIVVELAAAGFALEQRPAARVGTGAIGPRRVERFARSIILSSVLGIRRSDRGEIVGDLHDELRTAKAV